jgi:hypothetical protein
MMILLQPNKKGDSQGNSVTLNLICFSKKSSILEERNLRPKERPNWNSIIRDVRVPCKLQEFEGCQ